MIACNFGDNQKFKLKYLYKQKPKQETDFALVKNYKRCYIECRIGTIIILMFLILITYSKKYSETHMEKNYKTLKKYKSSNFQSIIFLD